MKEQNTEINVEQRRIERQNRRRRIRRQESILAVISLLCIAVVIGFALKKTYRERQEGKLRKQRDAITDMTLIEHRGNVVIDGYAGLMFFGKAGQTNQADAIMHYVIKDPVQIENMRHIKLGTVKKVSEWKGLFFDKYQQPYSWHELNKQ